MDRLPQEAQQQIRDWYLGIGGERKTYNEMVEALAEMGHEIQRGQIWRWIQRQRRDLERIQVARERAKALAEHLVPEGGDVEAAAVSLAGALCLEALADADLQAVQSIGDLAKVAHSLGRLQTSQVAREKWDVERRKRIEEAVKQMKAEVQKELAGMPELTHRLLDVVYRAEEALME